MGNTVSSFSMQGLPKRLKTLSLIKQEALNVLRAIHVNTEKPTIENKKRAMTILVITQFICFSYKAYREIMKEDERVFLMGKETKARNRVLQYLEPLESKYVIKGFEDGFDALKCIGITNLIIPSPSNKQNTDGDIIWQRNNVFYHLFSSFCHRIKLDNLLSTIKANNKKTTLLICVPSKTMFTSDEVEWIRANKTIISMFDRRHLVLTDCNCNCTCKSFSSLDIPKKIRHICTETTIFHGTDGKGIGTPLFSLKYTGNLNYEDFVLDIIIVSVSLLFGFNYIALIKTLAKTVFTKKSPLCRVRSYNAVKTNKNKLYKYFGN